ncbi:MAG: hypothetical protein P8R54_06885 [Myxococcota bacterium]|nr:hypothetical protein [Myxococcota bacterium]
MTLSRATCTMGTTTPMHIHHSSAVRRRRTHTRARTCQPGSFFAVFPGGFFAVFPGGFFAVFLGGFFAVFPGGFFVVFLDGFFAVFLGGLLISGSG